MYQSVIVAISANKWLGDRFNVAKPKLKPINKNNNKMKIENNFIQWKGTDLCMDFQCECGTHNHYDGYFAYYVKCGGCGQVYKMDTKVMMEKTNEDCDPLEGEFE